MRKVVTTNMSEQLHVAIKEFHRVVPAGIEFMVTNSRFTILAGCNKYHAIFVTEVIGEDSNIAPLHGDLVEEVKPITKEILPEDDIPEEQTKEANEEEKQKPVKESKSKAKNNRNKKVSSDKESEK